MAEKGNPRVKGFQISVTAHYIALLNVMGRFLCPESVAGWAGFRCRLFLWFYRPICGDELAGHSAIDDHVGPDDGATLIR